MTVALTVLTGIDDALAFLRQAGARTLCSDTRRLAAGDAFVAWPGFARDVREHVPAALALGACACLVEAEGVEAFGWSDARIGALPGLKAAAGEIAHRFLGAPSERLQVLAVTGTNGKTSTAWWSAQALGALGRRCGLIGTLGVGEPGAALMSTGLTTPDPVLLHGTLHRFVQEGFQACALEASSIGLEEHRLAGLHIDVAQFTNFSRDHLDYHGTQEAYWQAKARLFEWPGLHAAVLNVDDERGAALPDPLRGRGLDVWTYSLHQPARLSARDVAFHAAHTRCTVCEDTDGGVRQVPLSLNLIGEYNVANVLAVLGGLRALGIGLDEAARACGSLSSPPGRMQTVAVPGAAPQEAPLAVVDYAHTPDALDKALRALRPVAQDRGGALWCVFGCGGNRDATKRPMMGAIATRLADRVVLTSDNPRDEPAHYILSQILAGIPGHDEVCVIEDRAEAIRLALSKAAPADVVLIAGKGHETTQEVASKKWAFSDAEHARAALQERGGA